MPQNVRLLNVKRFKIYMKKRRYNIFNVKWLNSSMIFSALMINIHILWIHVRIVFSRCPTMMKVVFIKFGNIIKTAQSNKKQKKYI